MLLTIFKWNGHGSAGRHPHLLLKTSKGFIPNGDGMLGWGKGGYEAALEDVLPQKGVLSTKRESRRSPVYPDRPLFGSWPRQARTPGAAFCRHASPVRTPPTAREDLRGTAVRHHDVFK